MTAGERRRLRGGVVTAVVGLCLGLQLVAPLATEAAAPSIYGWWSQASVGGVGSTTQPDVPADGMLVQNAPAGAIAISALQFSLQQGATVGQLTLNITGQPVITAPPIACPATTAFKAAEGGPWSDHPSYDCTASVTGSVNAASTEVQFQVTKLVLGQSLSLVVLAGGSADRIAFTKPGPDALAETNGALAPPSDAVTNPSVFVPPAQAIVPQFPITPPQGNPVPAAAPPVAALPAPPRPPAVLAAGAVAQPQSFRQNVINGLALALILLAILYWSDGFGAWRIRTSLATRVISGPRRA